MKTITIINGPNLNLLGKREPEKYGNRTFEDFFRELEQQYSSKFNLEYYQSNKEGEIIDKLQEVGFDSGAIILNAGGYTHTSVAIRDAISSIAADVIEVHITNIYSREEFRKNSLLSSVCKASICGFGLNSYRLAMESFIYCK